MGNLPDTEFTFGKVVHAMKGISKMVYETVRENGLTEIQSIAENIKETKKMGLESINGGTELSMKARSKMREDMVLE